MKHWAIVDNEADKRATKEFQDFMAGVRREGIIFAVFWYSILLFAIFLVLGGADASAQNFSVASNCFDNASDAFAFFNNQFPLVDHGVQYSLLSSSLSGSSITYQLQEMLLSTGVVTSDVSAIMVLSDCAWHLNIASTVEGASVILGLSLGIIAGCVWMPK